MRLVLGENTNTQIACVDQIRQHEIDEPIGAAEGNCRLCPVRSERIEPLALTSGQDDAENVWQVPHGSKPSHRACRLLGQCRFPYCALHAGRYVFIAPTHVLGLRSAVCEWRC